jgi:hypothetical protein
MKLTLEANSDDDKKQIKAAYDVVIRDSSNKNLT